VVETQEHVIPAVRMSENIDALAAALAKAQASITTLVAGEVAKVKMKAGGEYSYKYAHLANVIEVCRQPLSDNGLSVVQAPQAGGGVVVVTTILLHSSGQFISSDMTLRPDTFTPQAIGSAITYARRYALSAIVGVAPEDDDGKAAQPKNGNREPAAKPTPPAPTEQQRISKAKAAIFNAPDLDTLEKYDRAVPGKFAGNEKALAELRALANVRFYTLIPPGLETMGETDCHKWLAWAETRGFAEVEHKQLTNCIGMRIEEIEQIEASHEAHRNP